MGLLIWYMPLTPPCFCEVTAFSTRPVSQSQLGFPAPVRLWGCSRSHSLFTLVWISSCGFGCGEAFSLNLPRAPGGWVRWRSDQILTIKKTTSSKGVSLHECTSTQINCSGGVSEPAWFQQTEHRFVMAPEISAVCERQEHLFIYSCVMVCSFHSP